LLYENTFFWMATFKWVLRKVISVFLYDQNQVESKSHKVSIAGSGRVSGMYRSRSLYKQRWGKSPHNIASYIRTHSLIGECNSRSANVKVLYTFRAVRGYSYRVRRLNSVVCFYMVSSIGWN